MHANEVFQINSYIASEMIYFVYLQGKMGLSVLPNQFLISFSGSDPHLERKILDPESLSRVASIFSNLSETIKKYGPWTSAWVGEAGGAYNSGSRYVSNTFLNSFW